MSEQSNLDMVTIFKEHVKQYFDSEISLSTEDEKLLDCFITYSMILNQSKSFLTKLAMTYSINLGYESAFKIVKHLNKFQFLKTEFSIKEALDPFIFLFNNFVCDNFIFNPHQF
jgi:hypothetical protein